jgi:REP element-mobilizing transposase RayT
MSIPVLFRLKLLVITADFAGSCGGALIEIVRQYIEQQKTPH